MKRCLILLAISLAGLAATATPDGSAAVRGPLCRGNPHRVAHRQVPVYVWLVATNSKNQVDRAYSTTVRWFRTFRHGGQAVTSDVLIGHIDTGCWRVFAFKRTDRPRRLCITVREGWAAPSGACQPVIPDQYGDLQVVFNVTHP